MSNPLVSVIVASLDGERYLDETLESLFAQTFESFECVFVDDGSTDGTAEIAKRFPVRYHFQANSGLPAARNAGLELARGALIAFLDDDDLLPPTKLSLQAEFLLEHPEVGCVLGRQEWIFPDGVPPEGMKRDPVFGDLGGVPMGSAMIRREHLDAIDGFDPSYRYAEDRDLFVRLREHGVAIEVLPEIVLRRRLHDTNMTLNQPDNHPLLRSLKAKLDRQRAEES